MNKMKETACLCFCLFALPLARSWSRDPSVVVPAPGLTGPMLMNTLQQTPNILYSDVKTKVTAYKSTTFRSCFLRELDFDFMPDEVELRKITTEQVPRVMRTLEEVKSFTERVGAYIGPMCASLKQYWMDKPVPAPPAPPAPTMRTPPPLSIIRQGLVDTDTQGPPEAKDPPPFLANTDNQQRGAETDQQGPPEVRAPPPPPVLANTDNNLQTTGQNEPPPPPPVRGEFDRPPTGRQPQAPPPLEMWRQRQPAAARRQPPTPPPLDQWLKQHPVVQR